MTPEPVPEEEDEIDPVEAVRKAVGAVDREEFEDGHELKQLIKNQNGVTLPDAGRFLLQALRSDDPPLRRDGETFVKTASADASEAEDGDDAGVGVDDGNAGETDDATEEPPDGLTERDIWAVRYSDGTVEVGRRYPEALEETRGAEADLGYGGILTVSFDPDEHPESPFDGAYAESLTDGDGLCVPVVGYEEPDWWSDVDGITVEPSSVFREKGEPADVPDDASAFRGGRALDEWLADALRSAGGTVFGEPPEDVPEVDGAVLTDERVKEALGHIDPDLPYPDWRRIGAALADNYEGREGGVEKAQAVFDAWSREGTMYTDFDSRFVRDLEGSVPEVGVGYLVHKACLEGWVWESDEDADDTDEGAPDERVVSREARSETVRRSGADEAVRVVVESPDSTSTDGRFGERDGVYGYETGTGFEPVTNFTVETRRRIEADDGTRLFDLVVHPDEEERYDVTVGTDALNSVDRFEEEVVTGFSTWFDGDESALAEMRERVGSEGRRTRGTGSVGLYGDEFVTPAGTLTDEGWTDEPDTVFVESLAGAGVSDAWNVSGGYDEDDVVETLERLPGVHVSGEFLTVLGWFYAAPLKTFIVDRADYFPSLWLTGDVEAAKPKLRVLGRAFGTDGEPFRPADTSEVFDVLGGSRSVPVWYDGYRRDTHDERLGVFDDYCLRGTRCADARRDGRVDSLTAPVVVTGDDPRDPSLGRRSIDVDFVGAGGDIPASHAELVGRSYRKDGELRHPDGVDLSAHAKAYYSWIAGADPATLDELWDDCRRSAADVMESRDGDDLDGIHDVRVTLFGLRLYQRFAEENGVEPGINRSRRSTDGIAASADTE
jgi:hypothetical protein